MTRSKKKILIITLADPPHGGVAMFSNNLYKQLIKKGNIVKKIDYGNREFNLSNFRLNDILYTAPTRNKYYRLNNLLNPKKLYDVHGGFRDYIFTNMVYRTSSNIIKEFKPDVIHVCHARLFSAVYDNNVPFVVTAHSEEINDTYPVKYILNNARQIHCVSNFSKTLVTKILTNKENVSVVYNSVDVNYYKRTSPLKEKKYITTICRLDYQKNVDTVIKAYKLLPPAIQDRYKYIIIGDGKERENLKSLIHKLGLNKKVKLIGSVSERIKIKYLNQSKLFVMVPRVVNNMQEGFGIVYLEAQAVGIPIISSNVGGIKDAVGNAGIYVSDYKNHVAIAKKILHLLKNEQASKKLQNHAKKRIKNFDHNLWINKIENIYNVSLNN